MELEIPHGAEREYLIVFGVTAIYVATAAESCIVGVSRDLDKTLVGLRQKWPQSEITCAFWTRERKIAKAIIRELKQRQPCNPEIARQQIVEIAKDWLIGLTSHDAALARVRSGLQQVEVRIREANRRGDLKWFNSAYRAWRLEAKKSGQGMSYTEALVRLRKAVTNRLIAHDNWDFRADLLQDIFPPMKKNLR